ncbi:DUF551 domain-containing protein [Burkholderia sp. MBR-1]|uniref:DUF551 domain-containing protein n=1 Tax=Burkholderia sp. MBR-1 TaxID=2732364 RepID=UPI00215D7C03|nr:DUF551 domain-containing protein [Burkholderia sp. MBR-1]
MTTENSRGDALTDAREAYSIEGTVRFMRSEEEKQVCVCCPPGGGHIFSRRVEWDDWETRHPAHFGNGPDVLINSKVTDGNRNEGKRVRLTVEVLDEALAASPVEQSAAAPISEPISPEARAFYARHEARMGRVGPQQARATLDTAPSPADERAAFEIAGATAALQECVDAAEAWRMISDAEDANDVDPVERTMAASRRVAAFEAARKLLEARTALANETGAEGASWIPVAHRLPARGEGVLVAVQVDHANDWRMKVGGLSDEGTWTVFGASWMPSHWMPLPAAPGATRSPAMSAEAVAFEVTEQVAAEAVATLQHGKQRTALAHARVTSFLYAYKQQRWLDPEEVIYLLDGDKELRVDDLEVLTSTAAPQPAQVDALEAMKAFDDPPRSGVGEFCTPGDRAPVWLLKFDDAEASTNVYESEDAARAAFARSENRGWNCWLFSPTPRAALSDREGLTDELRAEIGRLNAIINTPQDDDFLRAVSIEAEHQRQRWGSEHDAGKSPADWFWLVGYLAGKALHAAAMCDAEKAEHHVITTAAACANWNKAMRGETNMRPGTDGEALLQGANRD